jgi:hypothetical protein
MQVPVDGYHFRLHEIKRINDPRNLTAEWR